MRKSLDTTAVIVVARGCQVRVDIERIRQLSDLEDLVRICFAPEEQADFCSLPCCTRLPAFFAGWARKEAFLQATGAGITRPLASFAVSIAPDALPQVLRVAADCVAGAGWTLLDLGARERYVAAVAARRPGILVLTRDLSPSLLRLPESEVDPII